MCPRVDELMTHPATLNVMTRFAAIETSEGMRHGGLPNAGGSAGSTDRRHRTGRGSPGEGHRERVTGRGSPGEGRSPFLPEQPGIARRALSRSDGIAQAAIETLEPGAQVAGSSRSDLPNQLCAPGRNKRQPGCALTG